MSKLVLSGACILVLIALVLPVSSQVQNGEFTGLITDPSGAVVNQARVLIHNLGTGYTLEARSNEDGIYAAQRADGRPLQTDGGSCGIQDPSLAEPGLECRNGRTGGFQAAGRGATGNHRSD